MPNKGKPFEENFRMITLFLEENIILLKVVSPCKQIPCKLYTKHCTTWSEIV